MSALILNIKKEPEEAPPLCAEGSPTNHTESGPPQTEFVNIKTEIDSEITPITRIKQEPLTDVNIEEHYTNLYQTQPSLYPDYDKQSAEPGHLLEERHSTWNFPISISPNITVQSVPVIFEKASQDDPKIKKNNKGTKQKSNKNTKDSTEWSYTPEGKIECKICKKTYSNLGNFQRHALAHANGPLQCKDCDQIFTTLLEYQRHSKIHTKYDCDVCGKVFRSSSNLFQHKRVHMTLKPFICPLCGKDFTVRANLLKHQGKRRCKQYTGPITCNVCHKEFKTEFLLKSHLRRHTTEKPFNCDICDMAFKYKSTLIRHIQVHNGLRPYSCNVCHKSFTHISLLTPHMRIHTGEKPYKCPICSKRFTHKHNMARHSIRHAKEKKTVCEICHKKFPKESRLKYHMRTHIDEKHFKCFVCPKKFSHRQNVLRHYSRKHPNATYDCTDTDAKIASKLWEEVLNNRVKLSKKEVKQKEDVNLNIQVDDSNNVETEMILPDVDRFEGEELTKESSVDKTEIGFRMDMKIEPNDSDDEFLINKVTSKTSANGNSNDILGENNENIVKTENIPDKVNSDKELAKTDTVIPMNNGIVVKSEIFAKNNGVIAKNNEMLANNNDWARNYEKVEIKKEIVSDDEEILPDVVNNTLSIDVEIKKELDCNIET